MVPKWYQIPIPFQVTSGEIEISKGRPEVPIGPRRARPCVRLPWESYRKGS